MIAKRLPAVQVVQQFDLPLGRFFVNIVGQTPSLARVWIRTGVM